MNFCNAASVVSVMLNDFIIGCNSNALDKNYWNKDSANDASLNDYVELFTKTFILI